MAKSDYYQILGVGKDASDSDIKSAYRKLAVRYHPDKNQGDKQAEEKFKEINEAYDILRDEQKRAAYDRYGHAAFANGTGASAGAGGGGGGFQSGGSSGFGGFNDIFEEFFGGGGGGGQGRSRQRQRNTGSDKQVRIKVSLEDAFKGRSVDLQIPLRVQCGGCHGSGAGEGSAPSTCPSCGGSGQIRFQQGFFAMKQTCQHCSGSGVRIDNPCKTCRGQGWREQDTKVSINVPAGIEDGQRLRMSGKGNADSIGMPAGDLYVGISVMPHDLFERDGSDIVCALPISMVSAALGEDIDVPTIEGGRTRLKIPEGTQHGQVLRLKGKGMPVLNSGGRRGNMYVSIQIEVAVNLTDKQKDLLRQFTKEGVSENQHPHSKSFFEKVKDFF